MSPVRYPGVRAASILIARRRRGSPHNHVAPRGTKLIRRLHLLFPLLLVLPAGLRAQGTGEASARARLESGLRVTAIHSDVSMLAGATGLLDLGARTRFGAAAWVRLGRATVPGGNAPSDYRMGFGYGGVVTEVDLVRGPHSAWTARALLGAGNAKMSLGQIPTFREADNFGVFEPEIATAWNVARHLDFEVGASYRIVFGVEDLPNVDAADLRGFSLRLGIGLGNF